MLWHEITGLLHRHTEGDEKHAAWNRCAALSMTVGSFKKRRTSMLCLPPSPSTQIRLPLWSKLIPHANLPNRESEPGGKTRIVGTGLPPSLLPVTVQAFQWERLRCLELCSPIDPEAPATSAGGQDHVHHLGGPHHHRSDPAAEILQQNQTVSKVWIA